MDPSPSLRLLDREEIEPGEDDDDSVQLRDECTLGVPKQAILRKLCAMACSAEEKDGFWEICRALEDLIRARSHPGNEELQELYSAFDPTGDTEAKGDEKKFLRVLIQALIDCRFRLLTEKEWGLATNSKYLFHLPAKFNGRKLDGSMFQNFEKTFGAKLPKYCEGKFLLFRRGIGVDKCSGFFLSEKIHETLRRLWRKTFLRLWKWMGDEHDGPKQTASHRETRGGRNGDQPHRIQRVHMDRAYKFSRFFNQIHLQEPTFDRMVIIYRLAKAQDNKIHVKQYKSIPMADMELILPEKKNPRLPTLDWVFLVITTIVAAVLIQRSIRSPKPSFGVVVGIIVAFISYCGKVYYTFNQNVLEYERLISKLMHDKQIDSGQGALLHIWDEAIQLQMKEAMLAYFVLMRSAGFLTEQELCRKCNELLRIHFPDERCHFQPDVFVGSLLRDGLLKGNRRRLERLSLSEIRTRIADVEASRRIVRSRFA